MRRGQNHNGDDIDEENDCQILRSILNDGHYDISEDDHTALKSVLTMLDNVSDSVETRPVRSSNIYIDHCKEMGGCFKHLRCGCLSCSMAIFCNYNLPRGI